MSDASTIENAKWLYKNRVIVTARPPLIAAYSLWVCDNLSTSCCKLPSTNGASEFATEPKWRREYGGMRVDQAKRLKHLEKQNLQLKKIVADKELDIQVLKETLNFESKNF